MQQKSAKKEAPTLHAPGFPWGVQIIVNGAPTMTCPANVRVDENVYVVGVLGFGSEVSNCRKHTGRQKDDRRSGFPLGSMVTNPLGCTATTVNGTESQNADNVANKRKAESEISLMIFSSAEY